MIIINLFRLVKKNLKTHDYIILNSFNSKLSFLDNNKNI